MIESYSHFAGKMGYTLSDLDFVIQNLSKNYYHFTKKTKKPNGTIKIRPISPSKATLRDIQNRLKNRIFKDFVFPDHVQGSVRDKSYVTNAKAHVGNLYKFQTDISSFFNYVTNKAVNDSLIANGFSPKVASYITKLATLKGHLPQGTPTSSFLANLVGLNFDKELLEICKQNDIIYTRYVDDLTFSAKHDFQNLTFTFIEVINKFGFKINHKKTVYKKGKLEITGCLVNKDLQPTEKQIEKYRNPKISEASKLGLENHFARLKK